jgi:metal-responsive CopG/Arc/MetJ family transcriptional regulator
VPKRKQKKARLSVSLTEEQKEALEDIAERNDVSLSRVIQQTVKEFLENHQDHRLPIFERPPAKG